MPFVLDTFTDTDAVALTSHTGETGATWTAGTANQAVADILNNRLRDLAGGQIAFYASGAPTTADYDVEVDFVVFTTAGLTLFTGIAGRMSTSADTCYLVRYSCPNARWELFRFVAGAETLLGTYSQSLSAATYAVKLEIRDDAKKVFIDGVERISSADNDITAAGRAGFRGYSESGGTATTSIHFDNFTATDVGAAPAGATLSRRIVAVVGL